MLLPFLVGMLDTRRIQGYPIRPPGARRVQGYPIRPPGGGWVQGYPIRPPPREEGAPVQGYPIHGSPGWAGEEAIAIPSAIPSSALGARSFGAIPYDL